MNMSSCNGPNTSNPPSFHSPALSANTDDMRMLPCSSEQSVLRNWMMLYTRQHGMLVVCGQFVQPPRDKRLLRFGGQVGFQGHDGVRSNVNGLLRLTRLRSRQHHLPRHHPENESRWDGGSSSDA
jgi:hypothetical protein